jgi:hypothetical protein
MKPIVVAGVTPVLYQAFLAKLKTETQVLVETTPDGGKLSFQGTVIAWTYIGQTVTATPLSKAFLSTEGHLDEWIHEALLPYVAPAVASTANAKAFNPNPVPGPVPQPSSPAALAPDWKAALGLKVK